MFIEIRESAEIRPTLEKLLGITRPGMVRLEIGDRHKIDGQIEGGREEEAAGKLAAVQYVKFQLGREALEGFMSDDARVFLVIDHPNYKARAQVTGDALASLRSDFDNKIS